MDVERVVIERMLTLKSNVMIYIATCLVFFWFVFSHPTEKDNFRPNKAKLP